MTEYQKRELKRLDSMSKAGKTLTLKQSRLLAFLRHLAADEKAIFGPPEDKMHYGPREIK